LADYSRMNVTSRILALRRSLPMMRRCDFEDALRILRRVAESLCAQATLVDPKPDRATRTDTRDREGLSCYSEFPIAHPAKRLWAADFGMSSLLPLVALAVPVEMSFAGLSSQAVFLMHMTSTCRIAGLTIVEIKSFECEMSINE
jgi:hypothetical protein